MPKLKKAVIVVNYTPSRVMSFLVRFPKDGKVAIWSPNQNDATKFPSAEVARKEVLKYWNELYVDSNMKFLPAI